MKEPTVLCAGLMQSHRVITTKKGDKMAFAQFEDISGNGEVVIFPKLFKDVTQWLDTYDVFIIKGTLDTTSTNKCKIKANQLVPVELFFEKTNLQELNIKLPNINETLLKTLKTNICNKEYTGIKVPLLINFNENGQTLELKHNDKITCCIQSLEAIYKLGIKIQLIF
jgi:DNA polymerase-3 subunit alpha